MDLTNTNKDRKERRKNQLDLSTMVYGKIPPQAKDVEEAILGAMLIEKDAFDVVANILSPDCFYVEAHQRIFAAMKSLVSKSQPLDIHTVNEELRCNEELEMVGGVYYVTRLTNAVVSSANIETHCRIVMQKYIQRELIRVCGEIIGEAFEDGSDPFELLNKAEEVFSNIGQALDFGDMVPIDSVVVSAMRKISEWREMDTHITGVPCGIKDLDKATRGWQPGDLIIIAARPSVGKTALALNLIRNAAASFNQQNKTQSIAVWSLEMKSIMLVLRMLAAESREILYKIQTGKLTDDQMKKIYTHGAKELARLKIFFDDKSGLTIQKLRSKARKMKRKNNLGLIVVDYLQLMTPDEKSGTREQEVSKISRALKNLAQELEVPIIALSQMSRAFESRTGEARVPMLSDLRESGSIEQDADVVIFLWAPTDVDIAQNPTLLNRRFLRIAKQRNGVLIKVDLDFKDEIQLFEEISNLPAELGGGGWRPVDIKDHTEGEKLTIDMGSKMSDNQENLPF